MRCLCNLLIKFPSFFRSQSKLVSVISNSKSPITTNIDKIALCRDHSWNYKCGEIIVQIIRGREGDWGWEVRVKERNREKVWVRMRVGPGQDRSQSGSGKTMKSKWEWDRDRNTRGWGGNSGRLEEDREAWRAAIHGVAQSRTRLSDWTELKSKRNVQDLEIQ